MANRPQFGNTQQIILKGPLLSRAITPEVGDLPVCPKMLQRFCRNELRLKCFIKIGAPITTLAVETLYPYNY